MVSFSAVVLKMSFNNLCGFLHPELLRTFLLLWFCCVLQAGMFSDVCHEVFTLHSVISMVCLVDEENQDR